ncbi:CfrBI family restriction endonuclease [bacterium]|nr:CfrBI family restriction endonuclease [bacterium]
MKRITMNIPETGKSLVKYSGKQVVDKLGQDAIRDVVCDVLAGTNVRSLTENLTRRRLALSNAAMLVTYLKSSASIKDFTDNMSSIIAGELKQKKMSIEEKQYLHWLVGLTNKSIQNVLRSNEDELKGYLETLEKSIVESANDSSKLYGELEGRIEIQDATYNVNWRDVLQLFMAIGAQTLSIRGSEKSLYGKLFEKLVLGSALTVLGFEKVDVDDTTKVKGVFWLSQREDKRESDATVLVKPGLGVRFDIGFIGAGNPEISLDKVSRFERYMERGDENHSMVTIILVDRIGEKSRIVDIAREIEGEIIQMSMSNWTKELSDVLLARTKYTSPIHKMSDTRRVRHIRKQMESIDLNSFV